MQRMMRWSFVQFSYENMCLTPFSSFIHIPLFSATLWKILLQLSVYVEVHERCSLPICNTGSTSTPHSSQLRHPPPGNRNSSTLWTSHPLHAPMALPIKARTGRGASLVHKLSAEERSIPRSRWNQWQGSWWLTDSLPGDSTDPPRYVRRAFFTRYT